MPAECLCCAGTLLGPEVIVAHKTAEAALSEGGQCHGEHSCSLLRALTENRGRKEWLNRQSPGQNVSPRPKGREVMRLVKRWKKSVPGKENRAC